MLKHLLCYILLCLTPLAFANTPHHFKSSEHLQIGDAITLQFPDKPAQPGQRLHLPNGLALTYGEIIALGGDYYAVAASPIALGTTSDEQQQRFLAAFNTLAKDTGVTAEANALLDSIYAEENDIQQGILHGENPADVYARINTDYNIRRNCLTGGFCPADAPNLPPEALRKIYFLKQGRYLQLAVKDFDHFNKEAWMAYSAGHAVAVQTALLAHQYNNPALLENAYAMNAYACHFLSDLFSPGHLRTPRLELYQRVLTHTVGSLLANYMHSEDNKNGLIVRNARGETWKAYGDGYYRDARNQKTRDLLQEALQLSADDIFTAYQTGREPGTDRVASIIPDLTQLNRDKNNRDNAAALFYWDTEKQQLLRRLYLNDKQRYTWTSIWSGWETLLELIHLQGMPGYTAAALLADPETRKMGIFSPTELQLVSNYQ